MALPKQLPTTFVFVPGGWHLPEYFSPLVQSLASSGYHSETVTLNINAEPPLENLEPEVEMVLSTLRPLLEAGKDVIVVSHSYGGIPSTEAVGRLLLASHREGHGRVLRMVFMTAFVPTEGDSMVSMIGEFDEALNPVLIEFAPPYTTVTKAGYEILYHDVEQPYRSHLEQILGKHSIAAGVCSVYNIGWRLLPSTFIHATADRCLLPSMQRQMVKKAQDEAEKNRQAELRHDEDGELLSVVIPFEGDLGEFFIDSGHTMHVAKMEDVKKVLVMLAEHHMAQD